MAIPCLAGGSCTGGPSMFTWAVTGRRDVFVIGLGTFISGAITHQWQELWVLEQTGSHD